MNEETINLKEFLQKYEDDYKIPLLVTTLIEKMLVANFEMKFINYLVNKLLDNWQNQPFPTVEEGLRFLNAECFGAMVALQLMGESFDRIKNEDTP